MQKVAIGIALLAFPLTLAALAGRPQPPRPAYVLKEVARTWGAPVALERGPIGTVRLRFSGGHTDDVALPDDTASAARLAPLPVAPESGKWAVSDVSAPLPERGRTGSYVLLGDTRTRQLIDVSDPSHPHQVAVPRELRAAADAIAVDGRLVMLTTDGRVEVLPPGQVSGPGRVVRWGVGDPDGMATDGSRLLLLSRAFDPWSTAIRVWSNPASLRRDGPEPDSGRTMTGMAWNVAAQDGAVTSWTVTSGRGEGSWLLAAPDDASEMTRLWTVDAAVDGYCWSAPTRQVVVASKGRLRALPFAGAQPESGWSGDPKAPGVLAEYDGTAALACADVRAFVVSGEAHGLRSRVLDVYNVGPWALIAHLRVSPIVRLATDHGRAYGLTDDGRFVVLDVSGAAPKILSSLALRRGLVDNSGARRTVPLVPAGAGDVSEFSVHDGYVAFARRVGEDDPRRRSTEWGVFVVDARDPAHPSELVAGEATCEEASIGVVPREGGTIPHLLVACGHAGLADYEVVPGLPTPAPPTETAAPIATAGPPPMLPPGGAQAPVPRVAMARASSHGMEFRAAWGPLLIGLEEDVPDGSGEDVDWQVRVTDPSARLSSESTCLAGISTSDITAWIRPATPAASPAASEMPVAALYPGSSADVTRVLIEAMGRSDTYALVGVHQDVPGRVLLDIAADGPCGRSVSEFLVSSS